MYKIETADNDADDVVVKNKRGRIQRKNNGLEHSHEIDENDRDLSISLEEENLDNEKYPSRISFKSEDKKELENVIKIDDGFFDLINKPSSGYYFSNRILGRSNGISTVPPEMNLNEFNSSPESDIVYKEITPIPMAENYLDNSILDEISTTDDIELLKERKRISLKDLENRADSYDKLKNRQDYIEYWAKNAFKECEDPACDPIFEEYEKNISNNDFFTGITVNNMTDNYEVVPEDIPLEVQKENAKIIHENIDKKLEIKEYKYGVLFETLDQINFVIKLIHELDNNSEFATSTYVNPLVASKITIKDIKSFFENKYYEIYEKSISKILQDSILENCKEKDIVLLNYIDPEQTMLEGDDI